MKKLLSIFACLFISFAIFSTSVSATSWAELDPKDVIDNSEVIVTGQYDFTSKPVQGKFIFQGYDFHVQHVYKGEVSEKMTVGIDMYDVGWAKDFQHSGGEFLLFLIKSPENDFLVPFGGPNGMIQLKNGDAMAGSGKNTLYQDILDSTPTKTFDPTLENNESSTNHSNSILIISLSVLGGIAVLFLLYRYMRRK